MTITKALYLLDYCLTAADVQEFLVDWDAPDPAEYQTPLDAFFSACEMVERARVAGGYLNVIHDSCPKRFKLNPACELFDEMCEMEQAQVVRKAANVSRGMELVKA